jgi:hypothetical protein
MFRTKGEEARMVHYPKPFAELVRDAHRMRSEYALSLIIRLWSFLTKPRQEPKQEKPVEQTCIVDDMPKAA